MCPELSRSQVRGAQAGGLDGQQPMLEIGTRFLSPVLMSLPQMAFFYARGEGLSVFLLQ